MQKLEDKKEWIKWKIKISEEKNNQKSMWQKYYIGRIIESLKQSI